MPEPTRVTFSRRRIAILAHFDPMGVVDPYVVAYVASLSEIAERVVVVSTAQLSDGERGKLANAEVIVRENGGYDFMSWKVGIMAAGDLSRYDEVVLCNDSVYGPFSSLKPLFERMQAVQCDFWSLTANNAYEYHLQSYFVVYRASAVARREFQDFWRRFPGYDSKLQLVLSSEVGLTQLLREIGLVARSAYEWGAADKARAAWRAVRLRARGTRHGSSIVGRDADPSTLLADRLLAAGIPFLKTSVVRGAQRGPDVAGLSRQVRSLSAEWHQLISAHVARIAPGALSKWR